MIEKLVSGGQTGADRAALDVAIRHGFPHGGWCPNGRKAEDGPIGGQYQLTETESASYIKRTEWNVRDSDGTVVFTLANVIPVRLINKWVIPPISEKSSQISDLVDLQNIRFRT